MAGETYPLPARPRLRAVEPAWVLYEGEPRLWLRDPLELTDRTALIPRALVPLLAALDGTRDLGAIRRAYALSTGVFLPDHVLETVLGALDEALLLDSPRLAPAKQQAIAAFRELPFRPPALVGRSYPAAPDELDALFDAFTTAAGDLAPSRRRPHQVSDVGPPLQPRLTLPAVAPLRPIDRAAGLISPHIDYARGGPVYAATWQAAAPAVASAEVVVIFGTDHHGSAGRLTPTPQRYATPWGVLPADDAVTRAVAEALGADIASDEELHHRREHSIELAAVWLHWTLRRAGVTRLPAVVPVLCGSFHCYVAHEPGQTPATPDDDACAGAALDALVGALGGRRTLVVSAADLAHVGPAFGDPAPLTARDKVALAASDAALLAQACRGEAAPFLAELRAERDRRRVCGLPPTYWALRLLEALAGRPLPGRLAGYDVCPADANAGSVVSIAGLLWE